MQICSIVQPICTKSSEVNYTVDQLYLKTVALVGEMIAHYENNDHSKVREARENMLIGKNGTILDAIAALQTIALKREEFAYKYKLNDKNKTVKKQVTKGDLDIIEEFVKRLPEAYAHEQQHRKTPKTD